MLSPMVSETPARDLGNGKQAIDKHLFSSPSSPSSPAKKAMNVAETLNQSAEARIVFFAGDEGAEKD